jgi:hypothetical protein
MKKIFLIALILAGCSTAPTKLEQRYFDISTNALGQVHYQPNSNVTALAGTAGAIGNIAAPGIGGPIAAAVIPTLAAIWGWIRSSKNGAAAVNLAQTIETARELIKTMPNGAAVDQTLVTWMQQHQAEANVLPQVLKILKDNVDSPLAQQTAEQLQAAVDALKGS